MNCERELEVLDAVLSGRYPDACNAELLAHAKTCANCRELIVVAVPLRADYRAAMAEAPVPAAAVVWWRAQRRARREAIEAASRAITLVQAASIGVAITAGLALIGGAGMWLARISDGFHFGAFNPAMGSSVLLLMAGASALLLAPVAVWLATED
jgi:predicted anti-sigma-YlaC factor YlaD